MSLNPISAISNLVGKAIDKAFPDKTEANKLKAAVDQELISLSAQELQSAAAIITAEASGESWLQRNWRPLLMLWFAALVGAHWLGYTPTNLPESVVNNLLDIVQVGIGGYVLGRSAEKGVKAWRQQ